MKNRKATEKNASFHPFLVCLLVFIFLATAIQIGYDIYLGFYKDSKKEVIEEKKEEKEILDHNEKEITELIEKYDVFNHQLESAQYFGYLYKETPTVSTMTNQAKIYIALSNISFADNKDLMDNKDNVMIPREMVEEKIKELFGENSTYKDVSLHEENHDCRMGYFGYDSTKEQYYLYAFGHNAAARSNMIKTKILSAYKIKEQLEIEVAMYKAVVNKDGFLIYGDIDSEEILTTIKLDDKDYIFSKYKEEVQKYKYTFRKEKNNYIFSKIERVK